jgi:rSAM/selenodomain-associated transferase 1
VCRKLVLPGSIFEQERRSRLLPLIVVFAKAPRAGFVKTRLGIDPTAAASLYTEFVKRTLETVYKLRDEAELELSLDIPCATWAEFSIHRTVQYDGDLGIRLYSALEGGLAVGHPKVVILGSDSPTLPVNHIRWLLNSDADVALGPTSDGGYYGISCQKVRPDMFDGVRWSSGDALRDTTGAIERCGMGYELGPEWFDVDTPDDLDRFQVSERVRERP